MQSVELTEEICPLQEGNLAAVEERVPLEHQSKDNVISSKLIVNRLKKKDMLDLFPLKFWVGCGLFGILTLVSFSQ